jgi:hypothetical protein
MQVTQNATFPAVHEVVILPGESALLLTPPASIISASDGRRRRLVDTDCDRARYWISTASYRRALNRLHEGHGFSHGGQIVSRNRGSAFGFPCVYTWEW